MCFTWRIDCRMMISANHILSKYNSKEEGVKLIPVFNTGVDIVWNSSTTLGDVRAQVSNNRINTIIKNKECKECSHVVFGFLTSDANVPLISLDHQLHDLRPSFNDLVWCKSSR